MSKPSRRPLLGLIVAQFLGAFNDNAWKLAVALLGIRAVRAALGAADPRLESASQTQTTIAFAVFVLPLILVSVPAGALADRFSKRGVLLAAKGLEAALMGLGALALAARPDDSLVPLAVLGLMGAQSALFLPAKYGILPELLPHERLSSGNGLLEMWTFGGIIAGTAAGGALLQFSGDRPWILGAMLFVLALAGLLALSAVPEVPRASPQGRVIPTIRSAWSAIRSDRVLALAVAGATCFWGLASLLGQDILVYLKSVVQISDARAGIPLALFGFGVGCGAILAGRVSGAVVEYGLIPLGALTLAIVTSILGAVAPGFAGTTMLMAALGVASGLIIVPLNAILQWRSPGGLRGGVIALSNVFVFTGILAGSLAAEGLSRAGLSTLGILLGAAAATMAGTLWALHLLPDAFVRLVLVLLTHTFYRLKVLGREHVPSEGGALLVPNHVSFVDSLFIMASLDRRVAFVIDQEYFDLPIVGPLATALGAIPISAAGGPRTILKALRAAGQRLDEGKLVCIFAEGEITRTGMLLPFRRGMEKILKGRTAPVIPVNLDRVWGSIFSRARGRFVTKIPERIPYPVTVSFGEPLPPDTPLTAVRRAVHELGETAWRVRGAEREPLHRPFAEDARKHPFEFVYADAQRPYLRRLGAYAGAIALARALRREWRDQRTVGILLPPSVAAALVNIAASLSGRISVNLNYTAGKQAIDSAVAQAGVKTVVTSAAFLEKANITVPEKARAIVAEDLVSSIGFGARAAAMLLALLAPVRLVERLCGAREEPSIHDVVTIIFSSGSTGEPKGVMLTHLGVDSNAEAASQIFRTDSSDRVLGILPLFHSFGYFVLWFAANHRMGIVFHPNPLDAGHVGALVQRYRLTMLLATPTFLRLYQRRCTPAQFGSLRMVIAGAEKLHERVSLEFEDRFGIRPLEGYGTTECSPVIAASTLDFRGPGFFQPGSRRGSVGQPLPGVSVRIVDPETFEPRPPGEEGMIVVRGPNVMKGYLGREDLTEKAFHEGWYVTGDIASMDEDGFLFITDRLSRFSKIGGEMVPHGRVEQALNEASGAPEMVFAVTSVPDERKGERLAVLHTNDPALLPSIVEKAEASGLPNIFLPRLDSFVKVERIPFLGSGKLDLREARRIAQEALAPVR